ncbi:hypothetical protein VP01_7130g1, partial [Puccinia sorghi]
FLWLLPGPILENRKASSMPSTEIPPQQRTIIGYEKLATRSILAGNMGLGKTLMTLMSVLGNIHMSRHFQMSNLSNPPVQCASTMIICPLATHFRPSSITYIVFHRRGRRGIKREDLSSSLVVLTT